MANKLITTLDVEFDGVLNYEASVANSIMIVPECLSHVRGLTELFEVNIIFICPNEEAKDNLTFFARRLGFSKPFVLSDHHLDDGNVFHIKSGNDPQLGGCSYYTSRRFGFQFPDFISVVKALNSRCKQSC